MKKRVLLILSNVFLTLGVFASWIYMVCAGEGSLSSTGLHSLRYFTVQSNIFEGVVSAVLAVRLILGRKMPGKLLSVFKFIACVEVTLTFLTVMLFLGPIYGHINLLKGANLWMHLIVPVISILEYIFLLGGRLPVKVSFLVEIPILIYSFVYILNMVFNGIGTYPDTNDWYGFLNWGIGFGILIFLGICVVAFGVGMLLCVSGRNRNYYEE